MPNKLKQIYSHTNLLYVKKKQKHLATLSDCSMNVTD